MISAIVTTTTATHYAAKTTPLPQAEPQAALATNETAQEIRVRGFDLTKITGHDATVLAADLLESGEISEIQLVALQIAVQVNSLDDAQKPFNLIEALEAQTVNPEHPVFEGVPDLLQTLFNLAGLMAPDNSTSAESENQLDMRL